MCRAAALRCIRRATAFSRSPTGTGSAHPAPNVSVDTALCALKRADLRWLWRVSGLVGKPRSGAPGLACDICPARPAKSAMKRTRRQDGSQGWIHMVCAFFMPGLQFADVDRLEPVVGFERIDKDRKVGSPSRSFHCSTRLSVAVAVAAAQKLRCAVCSERGTCIQCQSKKCTVRMLVR